MGPRYSSSFERESAGQVLFLVWLLLAATILALSPAEMIGIPYIPIVEAEVMPERTITPWRPYGPYVNRILLTLYGTPAASRLAFDQGLLDVPDWTVPKADQDRYAANPDVLMSPPVSEFGKFQIDYNWLTGAGLGTGSWLKTRTDFSIDDGEFDGIKSSMDPTAAGIEARRGLWHLVDTETFVNEILDQPGVSRDCIEGPSQDGVDGCFGNDPKTWDTMHPGTISAYNLVFDTGLGGRAGPADIAAAKEHLLAAGLKDSDGDGLFDFPGQRIRGVIRSDDPNRRNLGNLFADMLDSLFETDASGNPVVARTVAGFAVLGSIVFLEPPRDDWDFYTGGFGGGSFPTRGAVIYNHKFASDICGGPKSSLNLNYGYMCVPQMDQFMEELALGCITLVCVNANAKLGIDEAGKFAITLETYSRAARFVVHNGWRGIVNAQGLGTNRGPTVFNTEPKPGFVSTGGLGPPGGGDPTILRTGFFSPPQNLNFFHGRTVHDDGIIFGTYPGGGVYEGVGPGVNPLTRGATLQTYNAGTTKIEEVFTLDAAGAKITVIRLHLRNDLRFHNGQPVTNVDVVRSVLGFRDVPSGSFGRPVNLLDIKAVPPNVVELTWLGHSLFHRLYGAPVLPSALWDTNGDGFICGGQKLRSCVAPDGTARPADASVAATFNPIDAGIFIGHGNFMCASVFPADLGTPGTGCGQTAAGARSGSPGIGGRFLFARYQGYRVCCPNVGPGFGPTSLGKQSWSDKDNNGIVNIVDIADAALNFGLANAYWDNSLYGTKDGEVDIGEISTAAFYFDHSLPTGLFGQDPDIDPYV